MALAFAAVAIVLFCSVCQSILLIRRILNGDGAVFVSVVAALAALFWFLLILSVKLALRRFRNLTTHGMVAVDDTFSEKV